jgi:hypothetical protein
MRFEYSSSVVRTYASADVLPAFSDKTALKVRRFICSRGTWEPEAATEKRAAASGSRPPFFGAKRYSFPLYRKNFRL